MTREEWAKVNRLHITPYGNVRGRRWKVYRDGAKRALRCFEDGAKGKGAGFGYIVGDCYGVHRLPYPATDALVEYRDVLRSQHAGVLAALAGMPERTEIWRGPRYRDDKAVTFVKGSCPAHVWESEFRSLQYNLEQQERWLREDAARVEARIVAAARPRLAHLRSRP